jgi:GNAT superfamily N-acetyltransferase
MASEILINKLEPTDKDLILKIANWYFDEWNTPIDKTIHRLTNQPNEDVLFQLVLTKENNVIATGGLCNNVGILKVHEKFNKFKPWVALLYTENSYRHQGLGKLLLEQLEWFAKESKLAKIYVYTYTAESLYRRCGWTQIERVNYKDHDTVVMEKDI